MSTLLPIDVPCLDKFQLQELPTKDITTNNDDITLSNYFIIPLNLVNGIFPIELLGLNELKIYLMFCSCRNNKNGLCSCGHKEFTKRFGHITRKTYKNAVKRLENLNLISLYKHSGKVTIYRINVPPTYDDINQCFISYKIKSLTSENCQRYRFHFFIVPHSIFKNEFIRKMADATTIYVFLKLIRYCMAKTFYIVNPSIIKKSHGKLYVSPNLLQDLNLLEEEFITILDELIVNKVFFWKPTKAVLKYSEFQPYLLFVNEIDFECYNESDLLDIEILLPYYQIR